MKESQHIFLGHGRNNTLNVIRPLHPGGASGIFPGILGGAWPVCDPHKKHNVWIMHGHSGVSASRLAACSAVPMLEAFERHYEVGKGNGTHTHTHTHTHTTNVAFQFLRDVRLIPSKRHVC